MKNWRVGTFTAGFSLILIGVLWLANEFWQIPVGALLDNAWPIVLIFLGIEVLIHHLTRRDEPLKFDVGSLVFMFILTLISIGLVGFKSFSVFPSFPVILNGEKYEFEVNEQVDVDEHIKEIVIEIPNADLNITGKNTDAMQINGTVELTAENKKLANSQLEEAIKVKTVGDKLYYTIKKADMVSFLPWDQLKADLQINIPSTRLTTIKVVNGEVQATDLQEKGRFELTNGDLLVKQHEGDIVAKSTNGDLEIIHCTGNVEALNTNGSITIEEVSGKLTAETVNGDLDIKSTQIGGNWDAKLTNGDLDLEIPRTVDALIKASSNNGEVAGDVDWNRSISKDNPRYKREGDVQLGKGTYTIMLKNTNGDIIVDTN